MPKKITLPIAKLLEHRENGLSYNKIAKIYKVSVATIMKRLKEYEKEIQVVEAEKLEEELTENEVQKIQEKIDEKPIKKATTPWNADSNPWSLKMLSITREAHEAAKRRGMRVHWFRKDDESLEKRTLQGWTPCNAKDYGLKAKILGEKGDLDTTVTRRELILMEMPEEIGKQRDAYIKHKTDRQTAMKSSDALSEHEKLRNAGLNMHLTVEKDTLEDERRMMKNRQM